MFDCVSIGDSIIDVFLTIHEAEVLCKKDDRDCVISFPYGEKIPVDRFDRAVGGNAVNNVIGLARLGFNTALFSMHGDDEEGKTIDDTLDHEGVDRSLVVCQPNTMSRYSTIINFKSERTILEYNLPHKYHLPIDFPNTKWVYVSSVGKQFEDFLGALSLLVKDRDINLAFTPNNAQLNAPIESYEPLLKECKIFFANLEEASRLLYHVSSIKYQGHIKNTLSEIYDLGPKIVVVTDGSNGSYSYDGDKFLHLGILGERIVSATGAGDAFASGFMGAIMKGKEVSEAMRWGTFNAGSVVSQIGAQKGLLALEEMEKKTEENADFLPKEI